MYFFKLILANKQSCNKNLLKNFTMYKTLYALCLFFLMANSYVFAQPANDNTCNAIPLTVGALGSSPNCGGAFPYDNTGAGPQAGEFAGSCWFSFVAPTGGFVSVSTDYPGGSNNDTHITLWEGTPCPGDDLSTLAEIGCGEDIDGTNYLSTIGATAVTPGDTYYIQLSGWNGTQGTFCLEVFEVIPCNNDGTCDASENICICADCGSLCANAAAVFVDLNPLAASPSPVVYCESAISTTQNPIPAAIYVPIAANSPDLDCVTWDLSSPQ